MWIFIVCVIEIKYLNGKRNLKNFYAVTMQGFGIKWKRLFINSKQKKCKFYSFKNFKDHFYYTKAILSNTEEKKGTNNLCKRTLYAAELSQEENLSNYFNEWV